MCMTNTLETINWGTLAKRMTGTFQTYGEYATYTVERHVTYTVGTHSSYCRTDERVESSYTYKEWIVTCMREQLKRYHP